MDKQAIINELKRIFIHDKELTNLLEVSNLDNLLEMYQELFRLFHERLTPNLVYQKQLFVTEFSKKIFHDIIKDVGELNKKIIEVTTLLSLSKNIQEFEKLFNQKSSQPLQGLGKTFNKNYEDTLTDFDQKIMKALNFNWKEDNYGRY